MLIKKKWKPAGDRNQTLGRSVKLGPTGLLTAEIARRPSPPPPLMGPSAQGWWLVKVSVHGRIQTNLSTLDIVGRIFADETEGTDKSDECPWTGWEIGSPDTWLIYCRTLFDAVQESDRFMFWIRGAYNAEVAGAGLGGQWDIPDREIDMFLKWQEEENAGV